MTGYNAQQIINDFNLNANGAQVDNTQYSGTPTTSTKFSNAWDIGPGVSAANSCWRLTVIGQTVMGTSSLGQTWSLVFGPTITSSINICVSGTTNYPAQPASSTWIWTATAFLVVLTGGAAGTCIVIGRVDAGQVPNNSSIDAAVGGVAPAAWNTTTDNTLTFFTNMSGSTGTPVITTFCSSFERLS